jgi:hypothetical protein
VPFKRFQIRSYETKEEFEQSAVVVVLLKQLKIEQAHLFGESFGGGCHPGVNR